jgi:hypothetical protein
LDGLHDINASDVIDFVVTRNWCWRHFKLALSEYDVVGRNQKQDFVLIKYDQTSVLQHSRPGFGREKFVFALLASG